MTNFTSQETSLINELSTIVGQQHLLTDPSHTLRYRQGIRFGEGKALAVAIPGTLWEQWQVLQACIKADVIVISQAANTGLTGGSTPDGTDYDRNIVIVSTLRITGIQLIDQAQQAICLSGSTLYRLEEKLLEHGREPHSVIGSSCIGASVIGGICNNSGGALVRRGPAYTEMSLFAQLDEQGELKLVNHLGITLGDTPQEILTRLENGQYEESDVEHNEAKCHDHDYCNHVRDIDADSAARFNADPKRHYEASGSAGKLMIFAVRLDTFPLEKNTQVFYIGSNSTEVMEDLRREILGNFKNLPVSGEYIHRNAFDLAAKYGKDTSWVIKRFGTEVLPKMFALKSNVDRICNKIPLLPNHFSDRFMQIFSYFLPSQLPKAIREYRNLYEHHLILKMSDEGIKEAQDMLNSFFKDHEGAYFSCSPDEAKAAMLHRFAVASAANRYRDVTKEAGDLLALDIALRRNDRQWFEQLPPELDDKFVHKIYYGHFLCHVMHQDYILKKGYNWQDIEEQMWKVLDERGAQYPAEHNVGHLYHAKPALKSFYQELDPTNSFNPGIGKTSKRKYWK